MEIKVRPLPQKSREFSASTIVSLGCRVRMRIKLADTARQGGVDAFRPLPLSTLLHLVAHAINIFILTFIPVHFYQFYLLGTKSFSGSCCTFLPLSN
jgi:hypothetical protein